MSCSDYLRTRRSRLPLTVVGIPELVRRIVASGKFYRCQLMDTLREYLGEDYERYSPMLRDVLSAGPAVTRGLTLVHYQAALYIAFALDQSALYEPLFLSWDLEIWKGLMNTIPAEIVIWACRCLRWEHSHLIEAVFHYRPMALVRVLETLGKDVPPEMTDLWNQMVSAFSQNNKAWMSIAFSGSRLPADARVGYLQHHSLELVHDSLLDTQPLTESLGEEGHRRLYHECLRRSLWTLVDHHRERSGCDWLSTSSQLQAMIAEYPILTSRRCYWRSERETMYQGDFWGTLSLWRDDYEWRGALAYALTHLTPEEVALVCSRVQEPFRAVIRAQALEVLPDLPEHLPSPSPAPADPETES